VKHDAETRTCMAHSLSGIFSFIAVKALTYLRLKTEKDRASYCSHMYFGISFHFSTTVALFDILGVCKCLNIAECFAVVLISAPGLATEQVISTEMSV